MNILKEGKVEICQNEDLNKSCNLKYYSYCGFIKGNWVNWTFKLLEDRNMCCATYGNEGEILALK